MRVPSGVPGGGVWVGWGLGFPVEIRKRGGVRGEGGGCGVDRQRNR